jgi:hypothetical protein
MSTLFSTINEEQNRSVQNSTLQSGFRPELVCVTAASGTPTVSNNSYSSVSVAGSTRASVRQSGSQVDFTCVVTLDLSQADPGFAATDELRIRVTPVSSSSSNSRRGLTPASSSFPLPVFTDVQIVDSTGTFAVAGQYGARLLHDGSLALVSTDLTAAPPSVAALVENDIAGSFGGPANSTLQISVRGSYSA